GGQRAGRAVALRHGGGGAAATTTRGTAAGGGLGLLLLEVARAELLAGGLLLRAHGRGLRLGAGDPLALALGDEPVVDLLVDLDLLRHPRRSCVGGWGARSA